MSEDIEIDDDFFNIGNEKNYHVSITLWSLPKGVLSKQNPCIYFDFVYESANPSYSEIEEKVLKELENNPNKDVLLESFYCDDFIEFENFKPKRKQYILKKLIGMSRIFVYHMP